MSHTAVTEAELRELLAELSFVRDYGFRLHEVAEGRCTIDVPFQEWFARPGGFVSGPAFMAAADVAMWLAVMTRLGRERASAAGEVDAAFFTAEMKTAFLSAVRREDFRCDARILKLGRRLIFGVVECATLDGRLLTHHSLTLIRPDSYRPDATISDAM